MWLELPSGRFINLDRAGEVIPGDEGVLRIWWPYYDASDGEQASTFFDGEDAKEILRALAIKGATTRSNLAHADRPLASNK